MTTRRPAGASETGSITMPLGFRASAVAAGIKPDRLDLSLVVADAPCAAAGVFTSNRAVAAPVVVSRAHLAGGRARAIVVNAGCANAATGSAGLRDAHEMAERTAAALGCAASEVLVASTGVIGTPLPMDKVRAGIDAAARSPGPRRRSGRGAGDPDHRHPSQGSAGRDDDPRPRACAWPASPRARA